MAFSNEVSVSKTDKDRIMQLLTEANTILSQYPYQKPGTHDSTVTTMTRAKNAMSDAVEWCGYLQTD